MSKHYSTISWTEVCAFWGMVIAGFSHFFGGLFRALVNWALNGSKVASLMLNIASILQLLGNIALLIAIAVPAYDFVRDKTRGWRIFYWVSFAFFVLGVIFGVAILF